MKKEWSNKRYSLKYLRTVLLFIKWLILIDLGFVLLSFSSVEAINLSTSMFPYLQAQWAQVYPKNEINQMRSNVIKSQIKVRKMFTYILSKQTLKLKDWISRFF